MVFPDFQPMRVSEEPVCIDLFRQNPVFTFLHLRSPVHVVPPLNGECRVSFTTFYERGMSRIIRTFCAHSTWRKKRCILHLEHVEKVTGCILLHSYPSRPALSTECTISFSTCLERRMPLIFSRKRSMCRMPRILLLFLFLLLCRIVYNTVII